MIKEVKCSLLDSDAKYIAHQTNCVSNYSLGLAKQIFSKFPYADTYSQRIVDQSDPGTINLMLWEMALINDSLST